MSSELLTNIKTLMPKEDLILFGSHALYLGLVGVRLEYRSDYRYPGWYPCLSQAVLHKFAAM